MSNNHEYHRTARPNRDVLTAEVVVSGLQGRPPSTAPWGRSMLMRDLVGRLGRVAGVERFLTCLPARSIRNKKLKGGR